MKINNLHVLINTKKPLSYTLIAPSSFSSGVEGGSLHAYNSRELTQGNIFTVMHYHGIISSIASLLQQRSPLTILKGIANAIVNPINAMLGCRSVAHIFVEVFKAVQPSIAYRDTSAAIIFKANAVRVVAPVYHCSIDAILRSPAHAMSCSPFFSRCSSEASTGLSVTAIEVASGNGYSLSTLTPTQPKDTACGPVSTNHGEKTEFISSNINVLFTFVASFFSHGFEYNTSGGTR